MVDGLANGCDITVLNCAKIDKALGLSVGELLWPTVTGIDGQEL
jgi:hypothetical protein